MSRCRIAFSKAVKNTLSVILALSLAFAGVPVEALAELSIDNAVLSGQETLHDDGSENYEVAQNQESPEEQSQEDAEAERDGGPTQGEAPEVNEIVLTPMDDEYIASGTWGTCSWTIDSEKLLSVFPTNGISGKLNESCPWSSYRRDITAISFSDGVVFPENCSNMFSGCYYLSSIDFSNCDTSSVTDMSSMFSYCYPLTSLDFSSWDFSSVTDMSFMFYRCSDLASIDVSGWNVSSLVNAAYMFYGCFSLSTLDVSDWDTSALAKAYSMFYNCSALSSLDVSGWDMSALADADDMFYGCSGLTSLDVSGWDTSALADAGNMFGGCSGLTSLDVSGWDTSALAVAGGIFDGCSGLTSLDVSGWDTSTLADAGGMFDGCSGLTSLDVSGWDVSSVITMSEMFHGCSSLSTLDVSSWDTSAVKDMGTMFHSCSALSSLDVSGWDTSSVTDMSFMFSSCKSLPSLDVSGWDTSSVTDMYFMFASCTSLLSLDVSGWDTSSVTRTSAMFYGCLRLSSLDVSGWDTSSATDMKYMYKRCDSLRRITVGTSYDVSRSFPDFRANWWSEVEGRMLPVDEIKGERVGVADTYWAAEPARVIVRAEQQTKVMGQPDPEFEVQIEGLPEGKTVDYSVYREPGEAVGTYRIVVNGPSRQDGMLVSYEDSELLIIGSIEGASVKDIPDQIYSGSKVEPEIIVSLDGIELKNNVDYTVTYENSINAGIAKAIVSGIGQYSNSLIATYRILPADISDDRIDTIPGCIYDGSEKRPIIVVHHNGLTLKEGIDYCVDYTDNNNAGEGHATIAGMRNYQGSINISFTIVPAVVEEPATIENLVYDGGEQTGVVAGDGYVLEGASSTAAGEYVARASLTDPLNHVWSDGTSEPKEIVWSIAPASAESFFIGSVSAQTYSGSQIDPDFSVTYREKPLVRNVDYEIHFKDNRDVGTATATIEGIGNFAGSKDASFVIDPRPVTVSAKDVSKIYGEADPGLTADVEGVIDGEVTFDLSRETGEEVGSYVIMPSGEERQGNYLVSYAPGSFTISRVPLSRCQLTVSGVDKPCYYNGTEHRPEFRITDSDSGRELVRDEDYMVNYRNNIEPGKAVVEATGTGNYEGTLSAEFTILPFVDVNGDTPHYADIEWLAQAKISEGWKRDDGTREFRGMSPVVRQDMAAFLYRLAGSPAYVPSPADMARFWDVDTSTPHYLEVWWLASTGITTGFPDGTFRGGQRIIRQDMAAFLHRLSNYLGKGSNVRVGRNPFTDVDASTPHSEDIIWMASAGITTGFPDGTYRGWNDVVRQDMAAFLHRLDSLQ